MEKWQNPAVFRERSVVKTLTMSQFFRKVLGKVSVRIPVRNWNIRLNEVSNTNGKQMFMVKICSMCQILTEHRKEIALS